MPVRRLPVRPDLDQLRDQARDLLRAIHAGDAAAIAELEAHHPDPVPPPLARLADAQLILAPAYTLSVEGTALLLSLGARVIDGAGNRLAPVDLVLQADARNRSAKHAILEMYASHGVEFPDTPPMALHRAPIDLLEEHLHRDPDLLRRTSSHREIYPAELGCGDPIDATVGTPLGGTTLLHMCVDYDEIEIARWLLDRGMDVDAHPCGGRMSVPEQLEKLVGDWTGISLLWRPRLSGPEAESESVSTADVELVARGKFATIVYTWMVDDEPQEGVLLLGSETNGETVNAAWVDSWHMSDKSPDGGETPAFENRYVRHA